MTGRAKKKRHHQKRKSALGRVGEKGGGREASGGQMKDWGGGGKYVNVANGGEEEGEWGVWSPEGGSKALRKKRRKCSTQEERANTGDKS